MLCPNHTTAFNVADGSDRRRTDNEASPTSLTSRIVGSPPLQRIDETLDTRG